MPIYEYECVKCKFRIEKLQKITDPPLQTCERCYGRLKRVISHSSFILKGTGWYKTDYARNNKKNNEQNISSPPSSHTSPDKSSLP